MWCCPAGLLVSQKSAHGSQLAATLTGSRTIRRTYSRTLRRQGRTTGAAVPLDCELSRLPVLASTHPVKRCFQYVSVSHSLLTHLNQPYRCAIPRRNGNSRFRGMQTGPMHSCRPGTLQSLVDQRTKVPLAADGEMLTTGIFWLLSGQTIVLWRLNWPASTSKLQQHTPNLYSTSVARHESAGVSGYCECCVQEATPLHATVEEQKRGSTVVTPCVSWDLGHNQARTSHGINNDQRSKARTPSASSSGTAQSSQ